MKECNKEVNSIHKIKTISLFYYAFSVFYFFTFTCNGIFSKVERDSTLSQRNLIKRNPIKELITKRKRRKLFPSSFSTVAYSSTIDSTIHSDFSLFSLLKYIPTNSLIHVTNSFYNGIPTLIFCNYNFSSSN